MHCQHCGAEAGEGANFCASCGTALPKQAGRKTVITGTAKAETVTGGDVAGVRVNRVTAEQAHFQADVIEVKLSNKQVAELARAVAVPTELTPGRGLSQEIHGIAQDVAVLKETLDAALRQLDASGRRGVTTLKAGRVEVSRMELLVKKAVLLETEAHQMIFDQARKYREEMDRRGQVSGRFEVDMADWFRNIDQDAYHAKLHEAYSLYKEANQLDPTNTEVLLHLYQSSILVSDDEPERQAILYRIKKLIGDPKNDRERYHLAQAIFLSATSGDFVQHEQIHTARAMFQQLGRADWVRACDEHLGRGSSATMGGTPRAPVPQLIGFNPVGRWQIVDSAGSSMIVEYSPNGTFQGMQQAGLWGGNQFAGQWAFDPNTRMLQIQGLMNGFMPFALAVVIQAQQGSSFVALDTNGMAYYMTRLG